MRKPVLAILYLLMLVLACGSANALFKTREYDELDKTVVVADWFGVSDWFDLYSVKMVENTDYCFKCHTIYEVCNLKSDYLSLEDFFISFYNQGLVEFENAVEYRYTWDWIDYVPVYEDKVSWVDILDNKTKTIYQEKVIDQIYLYDEPVNKQSSEWRVFDKSAYKYMVENECMMIKVSGNLNPDGAVDNRINLAGVEVTEFEWWNSTFPYCADVNIENVGTTALTGVVVLVNVSWNSNMQDMMGGSRFVNNTCGETGVQLSHRFDNVTYRGNALTWVKTDIPVGGANNSIYYGNAGAADAQDSHAVFSDYELRWDMKDNTTSDVLDSTANHKRGVKSGANNPIQSNSKNLIGEAQDFSNDDITSTGTQVQVGSHIPFTVSVWGESDAIAVSDYMIGITGGFFRIGKETDTNWRFGYDLEGAAGIWLTSTMTADNDLHHHVGVFNGYGTNTSYYIDGKLEATDSRLPENFTIYLVAGGDNADSGDWDGMIDEVRFTNIGRSGDWINESYQTTINNDKFVTFGAEEEPASNVAPVMISARVDPTTTVGTGDNIDCYGNATDVENVTLDFETWWYDTDVLFSIANVTNKTNATEAYLNTISSANTAVGDTWNCSVRAWDGTDWSGFMSDTVDIINFIPNVNDSYILPPTPHINDTLTGYCNVTDGDGDNVEIKWRWWNDTAIMASGNTTFIPSSTYYLMGTAPIVLNMFGANFTLECRGNDTINVSGWYNSTPVFINNTPPTANASLPIINSTYPNTRDTWLWSMIQNDAEGLNSTLEYLVFNGSNLVVGMSGNQTDSEDGMSYSRYVYTQNTSRGEIWNISVRAIDNYGGGTSAWSVVSRTILNEVPQIDAYNFTSDDGLNRTLSNLTIQYGCSDDDTGDVCDFYKAYSWYNDSGIITGQVTENLSGVHTKKHSNITSYLVIEDNSSGVANQTELNVSMLILNTPPVVTGVGLTDPLYAHVTSTCSPTATDADNDTVYYHYQWFNDTSLITGQIAQTLSNSFYVVNENITCEVKPDDLDINGTAVNSSARLVQLSTGVNVTVYDEQLNVPITWVTVVLEIVSASYATNTSTATGIMFITNLTNEKHEIRYWADGYDLRFYYLNVTTSNQTLSLYLLNATEGERILYKTTDTSALPVDDMTHRVLRRYISGGSSTWQIIEMSKSDVNGEGSFQNLEKFDVPYRFQLVKDGTQYLYTDETPVSRDILYFKNIDILGDSGLEGYWLTKDVDSNLRWDNASNSFVFVFNSPASQILAGRLEVERYTALTKTTICNTTVNGVSGSIECNLTSYVGQGGQFIARGLVDTNSSGSFYETVRGVHEFWTELKQMWGLSGAFYAFMLILVLALMGIWNPNVAIMFSLVGIVVSFMLGLMPLGFTWVVGLVIVGLIAMNTNKV